MVRTLDQKAEDWHRSKHSEARAGGYHMTHDYILHWCSTDEHIRIAINEIRQEWRKHQ